MRSETPRGGGGGGASIGDVGASLQGAGSSISDGDGAGAGAGPRRGRRRFRVRCVCRNVSASAAGFVNATLFACRAHRERGGHSLALFGLLLQSYAITPAVGSDASQPSSMFKMAAD